MYSSTASVPHVFIWLIAKLSLFFFVSPNQRCFSSSRGGVGSALYVDSIHEPKFISQALDWAAPTRVELIDYGDWHMGELWVGGGVLSLCAGTNKKNLWNVGYCSPAQLGKIALA